MAAEAAPQLAYGGLTSAACRSRLRRSAAAAMAAAARALASRASRASRCSLAFRPPRRPRFRSGSSGARGGGGGGNSKSDSPSEQEKNCSMSDICKRGQEKEKKTQDNQSRMVTGGNLRAKLAVAGGEPHSSLPTVLVHRHWCRSPFRTDYC